ncbi:uncharacterized protein (TIGR04141 family) [Flavobacterium sp. 260]|nr:uncharacterized protein (TIGR04141 family) [Curtobacterium sp. 260]
MAIVCVSPHGTAKRERQFVIFVFGSAARLLSPSVLESRFGLLLAAQHAEAAGLSAVDTFDPTELRRQRSLLGAPTSIEHLDPDVRERGVKSITTIVREGFPGAPTKVTGAATIRFNTKSRRDDLASLAHELYAAWRSRGIPAVSLGGIEPISDDDLVNAADFALAGSFAQPGGIKLSYPGLDDASQISLKYDGELVDEETPGPRWLGLLQKIGSLPRTGASSSVAAELQNASILAEKDDGTSARIPLIRCLSAEVTVADKRFVLFEGSWFRVERRYLDQVRDEIKDRAGRSDRYEPRQLEDHHEVDYNFRIAEVLNGIAVDRTSIGGGLGGKIEPSDVVWVDKGEVVLTCVKIGLEAPAMSHLFYQGQNAITAILRDARARDNFLEVIGKQSKLPDRGLPDVGPRASFTRSNVLTRTERLRRRRAAERLRRLIPTALENRLVRVEFVIISGHPADEAANLDVIPLFSRLSLARTSRAFRSLGVPMSVHVVADR